MNAMNALHRLKLTQYHRKHAAHNFTYSFDTYIEKPEI